MPHITAFSKTFRDWEGLIGNLDENGALVPGHEALKAELAAALAEAKVLKVQQESLAGNRVAATDQFLDKVEEGRRKVQRLRSFIVSVLGPESPYLKMFGIAPKPVPNPNNRRNRKRKSKKETPTQPPAGPPASEAQTKAKEPSKPGF